MALDQLIGLISGVMTGVTAGAIGLAGAAFFIAGFFAAFFLAGFLAAFFFAGFFAAFFLATFFFAVFFLATFFFAVFFLATFFFAAFLFAGFFATFLLAAGFFAAFFLAAGFFAAVFFLAAGFLAAGFFFAVAIVRLLSTVIRIVVRAAQAGCLALALPSFGFASNGRLSAMVFLQRRDSRGAWKRGLAWWNGFYVRKCGTQRVCPMSRAII